MARPRDLDIDDRLMRAARELADELGVHELSIGRVAERAGVSRPAAYRRWPTPAALIFELDSTSSIPSSMPDLGS